MEAINVWSRGRELNSRPADYESAALPLSYLGLEKRQLFYHEALGSSQFALPLPGVAWTFPSSEFFAQRSHDEGESGRPQYWRGLNSSLRARQPD